MFPKTTSKDTTAAQFVMEAGLSPLFVDQIFLVIRTFPIRVAGIESGPLKNEITWDQLQEESGYPHEIRELTTVTRKVRRVARFDLDIVLDACRLNRPTALVVHGLDYLNYEDLGVSRYADLSKKSREFLAMIQQATNIPIKYAFTGKDNESVIDMQAEDLTILYSKNSRLLRK